MSLSNDSSSHRPEASALLDAELLKALAAVGRKGIEIGPFVEGLSGSRDASEVAKALRELERRGEVVEWSRRWYLLRFTDWVVGRVALLRGGGAQVMTGERGEAGFQVRKGDLGGARDRDLVLAKPRRRQKGKGNRRHHDLPEASISKVLERRWSRLVGRLVPWHAGYRLEPFDSRVRMRVDVQGGLPKGARPGDYVEVELLESAGRGGFPKGRITEVLGDSDDPGVDSTVVLRHFGIPEEFPEAVMARMAELPADPAEEDFEGRLDLRQEVLVTIDSASARDFDDAISVEALPRGGFRLGVHIADVSHYVAEGSPLDREAYRRGTSVYFPERAIPMLPEELSNGLCSLRPEVPRLTVSAILEIDAGGEVQSRRFARSVIRSTRRMTYTEVQRILEQPRPDDQETYGEVLSMLRRAERLRGLLFDRRIAAGSLDFDLPEVNLVLDDDGRVEAIEPAERTIAHRLIEELMITANRAVAAELDGSERPALHRLHSTPDAGTLEELRTALAAIGVKLPASQEVLSPEAFQSVLRAAHGSPNEGLVSSLVLRSMKRAVYSPVEGGHFALSLRHYTHFTSPIRRYPDLLVHRQLKRLIAGQDPPGDLAPRLPAIAASCSDTERRAETAERELKKWKKVRFLAERIGETFDGTITGVQPFGLFVQLDEFLVDGLVPIRALADDFYHFEPDQMRLIGSSSGRVFRLGDKIEVSLIRIDEDSRNLDFEIPGMPPPRRRSSGRPPRSVF